MRLRVIDINFWFFWFTLFFYMDRSPGRGYHIESNLYEYQKWSGSWFNFWMWESMPDRMPQVALKERSEGISTLATKMGHGLIYPPASTVGINETSRLDG